MTAWANAIAVTMGKRRLLDIQSTWHTIRIKENSTAGDRLDIPSVCEGDVNDDT